MARTLNRLSTMKVQKTRAPGMYADGGGLYLRVAEGGSKQWIYRYVTAGRPRDMGLGGAHVLTLAEARERAREASKLRLDGVDPIAHKHAQRAAAVVAAASSKTFRECAADYIKDNEASWSNAKHRLEWKRSLAKYVYPVIGSLPVAAVDEVLVLKVLRPLWQLTPKTGAKMRGRIENIISWATVNRYRTGDNPARWQGHLEYALPAIAQGGHHAAMPYDEVPAFLAKLRQQTGVRARCLEFAILTGARIGEALGATWDEVDLDKRVWTVPASRMKAGKEHKVPLSAAAISTLKELHAIRQSDYVFPSVYPGKATGKNGPLKVLNSIASGVTVHGFRSSFRTWAGERTNFQREVCEAALAHAIPSATEAAYHPGDFFKKRCRLMDAWGEYCSKPAAKPASGKVVTFRGQQV
jgi:integrase